MPRSELPPGSKRKLIEFDAESWQALHLLARDRMSDLQELADEAFADLLKKHGRAVTLKEALKASASADSKPDTGKKRKSRKKQPD